MLIDLGDGRWLNSRDVVWAATRPDPRTQGRTVLLEVTLRSTDEFGRNERLILREAAMNAFAEAADPLDDEPVTLRLYRREPVGVA